MLQIKASVKCVHVKSRYSLIGLKKASTKTADAYAFLTTTFKHSNKVNKTRQKIINQQTRG